MASTAMAKSAMTPLWTFWQCAILMGISPADTAWRALRASAQNPNPEDVTSNTQWSLVYDDTALTAPDRPPPQLGRCDPLLT